MGRVNTDMYGVRSDAFNTKPLQMLSMSSLNDTTPKQSIFSLNKPQAPESFIKNIKGGIISSGISAAGGLAGGYIGGKIGRFVGGQKGENIGKGIGAGLGTIAGYAGAKTLGFKKGGKVKRNGKALVHKGEFVLPKGVKPTKKQIKKVRKRGGRV